jgi:tRNA pseudouridine38-40 synthase
LSHLVRTPVTLTCAGRTDAGVHARGQVAHVDVPAPCAGLSLERANRALPADIRVVGLREAPEGFDARFAALWRRYSYRVCDAPDGPDPLERHRILPWPRRLDLAAMNEAAAGLLGEHDFAAFCKQRPFSSTVRALLECQWSRDGTGVATLEIKADAFCHSMVRSLVGAMLPVGDGRRPLDWPSEVLRSGQRDPAGQVMPPYPLILEEVGYPEPDGLQERQAVTRAVRELGTSGPR